MLAAELGERASSSPATCSKTGVAGGVAAAAVERFGRLDGWVNNAGVQPVAALMEMTARVRRRDRRQPATTFRGTQAAAHG